MVTKATSSGGERKPVRRPAAKRKKAVVSTTVEPEHEESVVDRVSVSSTAGVLMRGSARSSDVTNFLRQLIMLLEAGTPILKSLKTLSGRGARAAIRALVSDIAQFVEAGNPLWQAFDRHPRYFPAVFVNMIKASEASGTLVVVLRRLVDYREKREMMAKRVRGASIYPVMLVLACFAVMLLLTMFVVPEFKSLFEKAGLQDQMPQITISFLAISESFTHWWYMPIVVVIALIILYKGWFVRSPLRRLTADRIKLNIPIIGPILHKNAIVELTRTMSLLLRSGLSMMATLELTRKAIHNQAVAESLQGVRDSVERGDGLEPPLREAAPVIPAVVADMFVTGEESGRVDLVCEQIADVYEEEVKIAVDTLGETLQPIFTVVIGIVVIVLFVALFLPLVTMIEGLSGSSV